MKKTIVATILLMTTAAEAVKGADITHLQGQRENHLISIGLVVGLNGTGDGGKFVPAIRPLAAFLQHFGNPVMSIDELKNAKNVALVSVTAAIGNNGAREGQTLDVRISAIGSAKSLEGGTLLLTPLMGSHPSDPTIYALAGGTVSVDAANPTNGIVKKGAIMEQDVFYNQVENGAFTLVIDDAHASWPMASAIAMTINEAVSVQSSQLQLATARDPKNVEVAIPAAERLDPANFIAWIQGLPLLMPEKQARVTINPTAGTIVIDGNVTISPVTITYRGMTISTESLLRQQRQQEGKADAEPGDFRLPDSVELRLVIEALEALKAPFDDRVAIVRELARSGNLQGQLVEQR